VIIKFSDTLTATVSPGLTSTNSSAGGFRIYLFNSGTGTVTFA
jgi:hypothetical protein